MEQILIRNYLDLLNEAFLEESSGGIARRWIEVQGGSNIPFEHVVTKEPFTMVNMVILPDDPALKYEDVPLPEPVKKDGKTIKVVSGVDLLNKEVQRYIDQVPSPIDIKICGVKNNGRAAMLVIMQDSKGGLYVYVKKVAKKRYMGPNGIFWQTTEFAKDTNLWAQTAQMKKAALPIEPTDFVDPGSSYSFKQLQNTVINKAHTNHLLPPALKEGLPLLLNNVLTNSTSPIKGLAEFQPAIEVKLSELVVPFALKSGHFMTGDYVGVNTDLLKGMGTSWAQADRVSFPPKAEKLIDATIHFGDEKVDISVKDSTGGARPSTATIIETLNTQEFSPKFLARNKDTIAALTILNDESAIEAPLMLAKDVFKVLDDADITFLYSIYNKGPHHNAKLTAGWKKLLAEVPYQPDKVHPEYQLGFHLLAVVAKYVASRINENTQEITNFFKHILSSSKLIQVYAKTTVKGDALFYSNFKVTWPPVFAGTISVDANSYTARTKPSRKISFSFDPIKKAVTKAAPSIATVDKETEKLIKHAEAPVTGLTPLGSETRKMRKVPEPAGGRQARAGNKK